MKYNCKISASTCICKRCGRKLELYSGRIWKCSKCHSTYEDEPSNDEKEKLRYESCGESEWTDSLGHDPYEDYMK